MIFFLLSNNILVAEVYSRFNEVRQSHFACKISSQLSKDLTAEKITFNQALKKMREILHNDIAPWAGALGFQQPIMGGSTLLFSPSDYFLQNAFVKMASTKYQPTSTDNWFGAYLFLSAVTEIQYLKGETEIYSLGTDKHLSEKIRPLLKEVQDFQWPQYIDNQGFPINATFNCRVIDSITINGDQTTYEKCSSVDTVLGDRDHPEFEQWIRQAQELNLMATPLFLWLINQPLYSVTYEKLFDQAMNEYKNSWMALGIITWMVMTDAHMGNRSRGAILSKRLEPIIYARDLAGHHYHFWGYVLKALNKEAVKYKIMAYVHEKFIQADDLDWQVDQMALSFGSLIREQLENPSICSP